MILLLVLTLALGFAAMTAASCGHNTQGKPVIVGTQMSQSDAKRALIELQDARVLALKSVAAIYVTDPNNQTYIDAVRSIDRYDIEFRKYWGLAALAAETWDPIVFVQWYAAAQLAVNTMKSEVPR
jgi:hypothetical protein